MSLILVSGCSTGNISLQTSPAGANVVVATLGAEKSKLIGVTPLVLTPSELESHYGGQGPVQIEFKKDGYTPVKTFITDVGTGEILINLNLDPSAGLEEPDKLNKVIDAAFEAQRLAHVGKYDEALTKVSEIKKEAPQLAATYEIEGGIFYLQKKYKESMDSYNIASKYNPKNPDTTKMRALLQKMLKIKSDETSTPTPAPTQSGVKP